MRWPSLHPVFRAVAAICLVSVAAQAEEAPEPAQAAPDATIIFRGRTASIGVGFSWGASTLEFQGKTYPVRVDGFVLGALGTATIDGSGEVYGLRQVEDLSGDYTALSTDLGIVRGPAQLVMRNNKGVRIVDGRHHVGLPARPRPARLHAPARRGRRTAGRRRAPGCRRRSASASSRRARSSSSPRSMPSSSSTSPTTRASTATGRSGTSTR